MCSCILLKVDISSKFHLTGLAKYELFVLLCWKVFATEFDNWLCFISFETVLMSLCLCASVSLSICIFVPSRLCVFVSLCLFVSVSLCFCVSVPLCLCVTVSLCLYVSTSVCLRGCKNAKILIRAYANLMEVDVLFFF